MLGLAETFVKSLKGLEKSKMEFITNQVVDLMGGNVYMYTRNRIEWHKAQGHTVLFVSGSPDYLVRKYTIDLASSFAYGDTMCDLSMFELVGNRVAINPTRELLTHLHDDPCSGRRSGSRSNERM